MAKSSITQKPGVAASVSGERQNFRPAKKGETFRLACVEVPSGRSQAVRAELNAYFKDIWQF